nr:hypothetical protein [Hymenobacter baengnokdamensis]
MRYPKGCPAGRSWPVRPPAALAAGQAGVLAAPVRVDEQPWRGLTQRQGLFQGNEHQFGGHLCSQVPAYHPARTGIAPRGQVAPAAAYQRQVSK